MIKNLDLLKVYLYRANKPVSNNPTQNVGFNKIYNISITGVQFTFTAEGQLIATKPTNVYYPARRSQLLKTFALFRRFIR